MNGFLSVVVARKRNYYQSLITPLRGSKATCASFLRQVFFFFCIMCIKEHKLHLNTSNCLAYKVTLLLYRYPNRVMRALESQLPRIYLYKSMISKWVTNEGETSEKLHQSTHSFT